MSLVSKAFSDIITFSRSSNATRIGPTGRVEYAPHNLALQSQTFDNASWTKNRSSITANAVAAPDGTITADKLVENTDNNTHYIVQGIATGLSTTGGQKFTFSVYAKAGERSYLRMYDNNQNTSADTLFNLTTGAITSGPGSITSVGNGWYRCSITPTCDFSATSTVFLLLYNGSTDTYTGDGTSGIYLWGAQLSVGTRALDYTPTTSAAVYGPRFDYDPVTLAAKGLLIEESRSNLLTYSEQFDNAAWTTETATVTANAATGPDGTVTAYEVSFTGIGGKLYRSVAGRTSISTSTTYTHSVWLRAKTGTFKLKISRTNATTWTTASLSNEITLTTDWQRVTLTYTSDSGDSFSDFVIGSEDKTPYSLPATGSIYVWGAQLEAGSFATSYIPTLASSVTRSADVASVNTLSPWYSSSESTLFAEFDITGAGNPQTIASMQASAAADGLLLYKSGSGFNMQAYVDASFANLGAVSLNTAAKVALAYNGSANGAVLNGGSVSSVGTTVSAAATKLSIGASFNGTSNKLNGHIRRIAYYPRRLTNAELQALTS